MHNCLYVRVLVLRVRVHGCSMHWLFEIDVLLPCSANQAVVGLAMHAASQVGAYYPLLWLRLCVIFITLLLRTYIAMLVSVLLQNRMRLANQEAPSIYSCCMQGACLQYRFTHLTHVLPHLHGGYAPCLVGMSVAFKVRTASHICCLPPADAQHMCCTTAS